MCGFVLTRRARDSSLPSLSWRGLAYAEEHRRCAARDGSGDVPWSRRGAATPGCSSGRSVRAACAIRGRAQLEQRRQRRHRWPWRLPPRVRVSRDAARRHRVVRLLLPERAGWYQRTLLGDQRQPRLPVSRPAGHIAHASATAGTVSGSATKAGLNLLGGTTFKLTGSNLTPFAEARGEIGGGKTFILTAGIRF